MICKFFTFVEYIELLVFVFFFIIFFVSIKNLKLVALGLSRKKKSIVPFKHGLHMMKFKFFVFLQVSIAAQFQFIKLFLIKLCHGSSLNVMI
jgi:hypothetical protein